MSITKPFHRNYRPIIQGQNSEYIIDKDYSINPEHYTRAFQLIQNDLIKLFEFIEPADENLKTFSFRIHELLIRTCIEIEANFKAILKENTFNPIYKSGVNEGKPRPEEKWNINDYIKINKTHHLNSYTVEIPTWNGSRNILTPFKDWGKTAPLVWYQAYNQSKHDRQNNFKSANFENLINAIAGLFVLLSSQYYCTDFFPGSNLLSLSGNSYYSGMFGIGGFFIINFPNDYSVDEKYDFNWSDLKKEINKFQKIDYNNL